jgi:hypothetical protein
MMSCSQSSDAAARRRFAAARRPANGERVVDPLEVVEIDAQHRKARAAVHAGDHFLHAQPQQNAIRQRSQRVVVRHIGDVCLRAFARGDVAASGGLALTGNEFANRIVGGSGDDTLSGGLGKDVLAGGDGADKFVFASVADSNALARDIILDFAQGSDKIDLSAIDAVQGGSDSAFNFVGSAACRMPATCAPTPRAATPSWPPT